MKELLPKSLEIAGKDYPINSDFRVMLNIFRAFSDPELNGREKAFICINNLFVNPSEIPRSHINEAIKKAYWFSDGGGITDEKTVHVHKIIDWKQDEKIYFPAINRTAGFEVRNSEYMHWWTFLGYFGEIGEGLFSQILHIRIKKSKGKKLEKWEQEFFRENKNIVEIKKNYTKQELEEIKKLNSMLD